MKRNLLIVALVVISIAILPLSSKADTVTLNFTGVNGAVDHGYYIDPYLGKINGGPQVNIWCVDFNHMSSYPSTWTANVTQVNSVAPGDKTYLHDIDRYKKMVYLITLYNLQSSTDKAAMQWVIWDLSSGLDHSNYNEARYHYWLSEATSHYGDISYDGWVILTDVNGTNQEFVVFVPEPSVLILLGIALSAVGLISRRFKF